MPIGDTFKGHTINVTIVDDDVVEEDETLIFNIVTTSVFNYSTSSIAFITIKDNDGIYH